MTLIEFLQGAPAITALCCGIFGLLVGSFLNVVIWRLPQMMQREWRQECRLILTEELPQQALPETDEPVFNLALPLSHCPQCQQPIAPEHNIPVLSWLWLRGRCAHCKASISARYPAVEALTGILSALVAWHFGFGPAMAAHLLLLWALITLTFIDIDHQLLPDQITLPLLWAGLVWNTLWGNVGLEPAFWGAVGGYLCLWLVYWAFKLITGKEGMGYGDFKLLAALGAWFGWQMLPLIVILSSLVGAVSGIALMLVQGRDRGQAIPFGPYLAGAGLIVLFAGDTLLSGYLRASGL